MDDLLIIEEETHEHSPSLEKENTSKKQTDRLGAHSNIYMRGVCIDIYIHIYIYTDECDYTSMTSTNLTERERRGKTAPATWMMKRCLERNLRA